MDVTLHPALANQTVEYPPSVPISSTFLALMSWDWMARYWPWRAETVFLGVGDGEVEMFIWFEEGLVGEGVNRRSFVKLVR